MKRTLLALTLIVVILVAILAIIITQTTADSVDSTSPTAAVRGAIDNYHDGNITAFIDYFCEPHLASLILPTTNLYYTFEDVALQEQERTGDRAIILLNATLLSHTGLSTASITWHMELTKHNNSWCIASLSSP